MDQQERRQGDTVLQLKDDIDSGRSGDKVGAADPGMASLGTCDEAGGTPPTPDRIALARRQEQTIGRLATAGDKPNTNGPLLIMIGVAIIVAIVVIGFFALR